VTRTVTRQVSEKATELYWKVEMSTDNVDTFKPKVYAAKVGYQSLVHDFYYNSAVIPNSNINYFASFESPDYSWAEQKNRGHLYALQTFEHGSPPAPVLVEDGASPELTPESQPVSYYNETVESGTVNLFKWDAGVTLKDNVSGGTDRNIFTYVGTDVDSATLLDSPTRLELSKDTVDSQIRDAMQLDSSKVNGVWLHNFHDPGAVIQDRDSASLWLANWIHGYYDPVVAGGAVVSRDVIREWILGGINRASPMIVRAPGLPYWIENTAESEIPIATRTSYINWANSFKDLPTRVIIGSESGLIHSFDAGKWVGEVETAPDGTEYDWAEGHYEDEDFGDGSEIWAFLPGHLLEDMKYNYTNANPDAAGVVGSSDATGVYLVMQNNADEWRRVAVFVQGFQGGTAVSGGNVNTGNAVWALDITDPDDPVPLWQRQDAGAQDLINPAAMGWLEQGAGSPVWVAVYPSGGTPVAGSAPRFYIVDAWDGSLISEVSLGSAGEVMLGTPSLVDTDRNGFVDSIVGATSGGTIFVYDTTAGSMTTRTYSGKSFYIAPNIDPRTDGSMRIAAVSGDNPLIYDEGTSGFINTVYVIDYADGSFTDLGDVDLPANHKAFSRPKIVGDQLVVGTTTGDTFNFCDFDPDDPGDLILIDLEALGTSDEIEDQISGYGSILAPIIIINSNIFIHKTSSSRDDTNQEGSIFRIPQNENYSEELASVSVGETFGILGWQDKLLDKVRGL